MSIDMEDQYDKVYRYCYFRLRNRQTAEDITQETFLRYLEKYQANTMKQDLKCLYTIARNLCVDEYRRQSREQPWDTQSISENETGSGFMQEILRQKVPAQTQEAPDEHFLTSLAVRAAVASLGQEEQELLLLRYVNEVPMQTLAQLSGISRFAMYRRLNAVTKRFKENLKKEGIE